jgi:hypothetical protein
MAINLRKIPQQKGKKHCIIDEEIRLYNQYPTEENKRAVEVIKEFSNNNIEMMMLKKFYPAMYRKLMHDIEDNKKTLIRYFGYYERS